MHFEMYCNTKTPIRMKLFHLEPFCRGTCGTFFVAYRKRFRSAASINQSVTGKLGGAAQGMNLNGMTMIQRSMKLSSNTIDFELTRMEIACLKLAANGFRSTEIGSELNTTDNEIEIQLSSAERKLGARNRLHAIGIAVSQGLIGIDGK